MPQLLVEGLPAGDSGRLLVRLNHKHRQGVNRFGIALLTNEDNGMSCRVLLLGHARMDAVFMPFDIREALGTRKGAQLTFSVRRVSSLGKLAWYVRAPDPAVHIPAILSVVGAALGILGIAIAVIPLLAC